MIHIREIDHLVLRVLELERMLGFYCGALGCTVERRQDDIGLVQLRAGRSIIDLVPVDSQLGRIGGAAPGAQGHNMDHFCLRRTVRRTGPAPPSGGPGHRGRPAGLALRRRG